MAEMFASITLIGDYFDLNQITKQLGVSPNYQRRSSEILKNGRAFGHCEWGLTTEVFNAEEIVTVVNALMKTLLVPCDLLRQTAMDAHAKWNLLFTIYVYEDFPIVVLPPDFSKFAGEIDAAIGFDVYLCNK